MEVYRVDGVNKRIGINRTPASADLETKGDIYAYGDMYANRGVNLIGLTNWGANGLFPTLYAQKDIFISPNIANTFCFKQTGDYSHLSGRYNYEAASPTSDTINDTRSLNSSGIIYTQVCTGVLAGALNVKGSGTWTQTSQMSTAGSVILSGTFRTNSGGGILTNTQITGDTNGVVVIGNVNTSASPAVAFYNKNAEYSRALNDLSINYLAGKYRYEAASPTTDTLNDTRSSNSSGVIKYEVCTGANAIKGAGTWKRTSGVNEFGGQMISLTNKTGANSVKGTVVYASATTDNAFNINPIDGDMPIGVVYENAIADGGECWVVVSGIAEVLLVDSVASTRSHVAYSSATTAGRIDTAASVPAAATHFREVGHTLESKTAGTNVLCKCILHFN